MFGNIQLKSQECSPCRIDDKQMGQAEGLHGDRVGQVGRSSPTELKVGTVTVNVLLHDLEQSGLF